MSTNQNEVQRIVRAKAEVRTSRWYLTGGLIIGFAGLVLLGIAPLAGLLFLVLGLSMIIAGSRLSQRWRCSSCGNRVDRHARLCPTCRAQFQ